ncbi:Shikimate kinase I [hydrothermal vent metagenome]|uniref:shikimate kinase n=1 Tax=hydrothermal vent metagenome TaxID=652676 RepID=A0A3B0US58_9ZZZZ
MQASGAKNHNNQGLLLQLKGRPIVLVGMMGAGKTSVGRRLAAQLGRSFVDSDFEIEAAAGMNIEDFFAIHGEDEFRSGETKVIERLLKQSDIVLATGGGAFINPQTRAVIARRAVSVWIKAEFELLFSRVSRRSNRPLLKTPDPRQTLKKLIEQRYPIYKLADLTVVSTDVTQDMVARQISAELGRYLSGRQKKETKQQ